MTRASTPFPADAYTRSFRSLPQGGTPGRTTLGVSPREMNCAESLHRLSLSAIGLRLCTYRGLGCERAPLVAGRSNAIRLRLISALARRSPGRARAITQLLSPTYAFHMGFHFEHTHTRSSTVAAMGAQMQSNYFARRITG